MLLDVLKSVLMVPFYGNYCSSVNCIWKITSTSYVSDAQLNINTFVSLVCQF